MLGIELKHDNGIQLWRQIYHALKHKMLDGQLEAGEVLPSTRELSKQLGVSRNTVCEAYDLLAAEGFILSHQGAPTRVAEGLSIQVPPIPPVIDEDYSNKIRISFRTGRPDLRQFPFPLWQQLMNKSIQRIPLQYFEYSGPEGLPWLRSEIAEFLFRRRGIRVRSEDIFITSGATHALHLISSLLAKKSASSTVLMEDPCHMGMLQSLLQNNSNIIPIPVDDHGMQTKHLPLNEKADAIYVTPSHQFPLGGILPAARRVALIRFAQKRGSYIIEDDYDSEFRYSGEPVAPLFCMDPSRVIYVGTFSKTVFPALRIGYVILPLSLQRRWCELRTYTDVQNPLIEQAALAEFLSTRKIDRHIQKMRKIYAKRREVLLESLKSTCGQEWRSYGDAAGLHVCIEFNELHDEEAFSKYCISNGIEIAHAESYCMKKGMHRGKLILGYGHLEPKEIRDGLGCLASALETFLNLD